MVQSRVQDAHQLPGSIGSISGSQMLCAGPQECDSLAQNGQYECSHILCEQTRGTVSQNLTAITKELWLWCLQRDITLIAEHLLGVQNTVADEESRVMNDRTDWKLNPEVFSRIDRELAVDLFASRLTNQLPRYFSWRPDPEAEAMNAFSQQWDKLGGKGYANPPWNLVGRTLSQVQAQRVTIVLVAPVWKAQTWYPTLLGMLMDFPISLHHQARLIQPSTPIATPEVEPQLAAWPISGNSTKTSKFLVQAQNYCWRHGGQNPHNHMIPFLEGGCAGVVKGVRIPFQDL